MTRAAFAACAMVFGLLAFTMPGAEAQPSPDSENGRYSFNQLPEGLLRLDSRTGQVSLCEKRAVGWSCQLVPDERSALEAEIARLQNETAALKKEMIARGITPPTAGGKSAQSATPKKNEELILKLPSDADLERVMSFFEKMWRRLMDMVQTMQKEKELEKKS